MADQSKTRKIPGFEVTITTRQLTIVSRKRKRKVYDAELGRLCALGFPSAADAAAEIRAQLEHLAAHAYPIEHLDAAGNRWTLRAIPDGWQYRVPKSGCTAGMSRTVSEEDALRSMVEHARQYCEEVPARAQG